MLLPPCSYPAAGGGDIIVHKRTPGIPVPITPAGLGRDIKLPCGNCTGCRLDRSKQWAIRLMHEAQQHKKNSFVTLTYNDDTLNARRLRWEPTVPYTPPSRAQDPELNAHTDEPLVPRSTHEDSLRVRDVQLFMKRLRFNLTTQRGSANIRYYLVGEYGDLYGRPHYHIALFGEDFTDDRTYWRTSGDYRCYRSSRLEKLWTDPNTGRSLGNSEIGELTYESAAYVARYIMKKINGKKADEHYRRDTPEGETFWIQPEFALMSRRPGIGKDWLHTYTTDVYTDDHVIMNGMKFRPPRYYDKLMMEFDPVRMTEVKFEREIRAKELSDDNTPARLADKEKVTTAKLNHKKRNLEQ